MLVFKSVWVFKDAQTCKIKLVCKNLLVDLQSKTLSILKQNSVTALEETLTEDKILQIETNIFNPKRISVLLDV